MPKDFTDCVGSGGKVRTVSGPNKEYGLAKGEYVRYCTDSKGSHRGHVKKKQKTAMG